MTSGIIRLHVCDVISQLSMGVQEVKYALENYMIRLIAIHNASPFVKKDGLYARAISCFDNLWKESMLVQSYMQSMSDLLHTGGHYKMHLPKLETTITKLSHICSLASFFETNVQDLEDMLTD